MLLLVTGTVHPLETSRVQLMQHFQTAANLINANIPWDFFFFILKGKCHARKKTCVI